MFYVYILRSSVSQKYYIGHTSDVLKRLHEHNHPRESKYTSKYLPWEVALSFLVGESRGDAMRLEVFLKRQKSRVFLEMLISHHDDSVYFSHFVKDILSR